MKKLISLCFAFSLVTAGFSQFKIEAGATVTFNGNATLVLQDVDLVNEGTINEGTSTIVFKGAADSDITSGGATLYNLSIEKDAGFNVTALDATVVSNALSFDNTDNKLKIGNFDLNLESGATITGADTDDYIVTDGTGEVVKQGLAATAFTYPVGFDESTYNPIIITENGASDDIGVRVLENAYDDGTSAGTQLSEEVVNATWLVTEVTAGGSDLEVTAQWAASDETADLDRLMSGIARYDGTSYDLTLANTGAAAGSDPYTVNRTGLEPGSLIVGGSAIMDEVLVAPIVLLSGPFNGTDMNDDLRVEGQLPLTEPYTGLGFTHVGLGGGELVASAADFDQPGTADDIVDWIFLELRDKANNQTIMGTQSALLTRSGNIVGTDHNPIEFKGFSADDYFVAVRHRNHLSIMSNAVQSLDKVSAATLDFSDNSTATFGTDAQRESGGSYFLWSGNGNGNTNTIYQGAGSDITPITSTVFSDPGNTLFESSFPSIGYHISDYDLSGETIYQGAGSDITPLTLSVFSNPANTLFESSFPVAEQLPEN